MTSLPHEQRNRLGLLQIGKCKIDNAARGDRRLVGPRRLSGQLIIHKVEYP